ncbi:MAG: hypothetical protein ABR549_19380, partial [Mycobacteriales bacterium]
MMTADSDSVAGAMAEEAQVADHRSAASVASRASDLRWAPLATRGSTLQLARVTGIGPSNDLDALQVLEVTTDGRVLAVDYYDG